MSARPAFDPAEWLARLEVRGSEVHLFNGMAVVRTLGRVGFRYLSQYVTHLEDEEGCVYGELRRGLPYLVQFVDHLRSLGRRDIAIITAQRDYPDLPGMLPIDDHMRKGDHLTLSSIPGLRGSGVYAYRYDDYFLVVGWIDGRTKKGEPRRRIDLPGGGTFRHDTQHLFRVIEIGRDEPWEALRLAAA